MSEHTAGPWAHYDKLGESKNVIVSTNSKIVIARLSGNQAARKANACLIFAALDLLAALQGILSGAGRHTIEFDAARAAIKKAIGESV
jgi:hypothetical protein